MLRMTLIFFLLAVLAGLFGFGGIASGFAGLAKFCFFLFVVLLVLSLIAGLARGGSRNVASLVLATSLLTLAGCSSAENDDLAESYQDAWKETKEWSEDSWSEFVDDAESRLARLEARYTDLREKAETGSESARRKLEEVGDELAADLRRAKERVAKLGSSGKDAWKDLSAATKAALDDLGRGIDSAWESLVGDNA